MKRKKIAKKSTKIAKDEELLRQIKIIVENSHDAIVGQKLNGVITSWNGGAQRMFGYSAKEAIGRSAIFLLPRDRKHEVADLFEHVRKGEFIADYDSVVVCKDKSKIDVALSISPVKVKKGKVIGASVVLRDITERKKSEEHILELNRVRNKFISIISHQLRTPLTSVNWNLELLLNNNFGELKPTQHNFLAATHKASLEITHRVHKLLLAMDIEEGRIQYEKTEVALDSIAAAVVQQFKDNCSSKKLSCTYTRPAKDLPAIEADSEKLRMVMSILLENAIDYSHPKGKITTSLKQVGGFMRFEITDKGIGIPTPEQHRVFSRFFRASNASVLKTDAFGLGLYIAKHFVEQHQGSIGFKSKEGKGSTFWFKIPINPMKLRTEIVTKK